MRMIDKIIRAMQDTGLIDGMSVEDCDTLATAALEELGDMVDHFSKKGFEISRDFDEEFLNILGMALNE